LKLECFYAYLNLYTGGSGAFIARQGYTGRNRGKQQEFHERGRLRYWFEGKPAQGDIVSPSSGK